MTDTLPIKAIQPLEPKKSDQVSQQSLKGQQDQAEPSGSPVQQSQVSQSSQHTVLGRKPLFRR